MRERGAGLDEIKQRILSLKGERVRIAINRGRKRIEKFDGSVESVYPSVFTVMLLTNKTTQLQTFSYSDVLCGDVKIN